MNRTLRKGVVVVAALSIVLAACGDDDDDDGGGTGTTAATETTTGGSDTSAGGECSQTDEVKLQLQWFTQAQFAGYYAAKEKGFYADECLDVEIVEGGVDIVPQTQLATNAVDYAIAWVPKALASREQGAGITNVGQIFQRSGTLQVAWADSGIEGPADLEGKKVGNWGFGNEFELFAGMTKAGLSPKDDVELVQQQFDMQALLKREIDAAQAMTYNELAQVLETKNPETGELYTLDDLSIINWNDVGTAMLQDAIWANTEKLKGDEAYQDQTKRFVKASIKGWAYCRDNVEECRDIVVAQGSKLGNSHQLWMMNEVNKLVWPSADGAGIIDEALWQQTVDVALNTKNAEDVTVLTKEPDADSYTNEYVQAALEELKAEGIDVTGDGFEPMEVELQEGGA